MPDKKLTDAEIIKALECCIDDDKDIDDACMKCPMICDRSCIEILHERLYKIINCQQAEVDNYKQIAENQQKIILDKAFENKRLKEKVESQQAENENLNAEVGKMVAEIERLKAENDNLKNGFFQEHYKTEESQELLSVRKAWEKAQTDYIKLNAEWEGKYKTAKAEAYKECIEKVKEEIAKALESNYKARAEKENKEINLYLDNPFWSYCTGKIDCLRGIDDFCNNLLKELVGEDNG